MLPEIPDYDRLVAAFRWRIPQRYNIGVDVCDRWAAREPANASPSSTWPPTAASRLSPTAPCASTRTASPTRCANAASRRGDRVAILLPQGAAVPIAHVAVYKLGAVAVPLATLFGVDALGYRLRDAGARALVTNARGRRQARAIRADLPALESCVISIDACRPPRIFWPRRSRARARLSRRSTPPPTIRR